MKKITLIILSLIIGFAAIAKVHKHRKTHRQKNQVLSVSMRRTPCYGRCPDYTIKIDKDGLVTYTGKRFVTDTGTFQKSIGSTQAMEIINQFNTYQVDTCKDVYEARVTDIPGIILTIQYETHTKTINDANFGPFFLKQLAKSMDATGNKTDNTGWEKVTVPAK